MENCDICCEKLNKINHKQVKCPFCDLTSCRTCSQKYILSSFEDPHCMGCKTRWNREFIDSFCTVLFRNKDLKRHRENVLFERERALMPATQPEVERILAIMKMNSVIKEYKVRLITLHNRYSELDYTDTIQIGEEIGVIYTDMEHAYRELTRLRNMGQMISVVDSSLFTRQCPEEKCKGFLNHEWYCGLCDQRFCKECNEKLSDDHECDPDVVKTMKLLNRDSKSCPKCGMVIHKLNGCSQMWCISCHTAFDWRTGEIVSGRVHNPHYIEFKRQNINSREHGDIPCGGIPSFRELREIQSSDKILNYYTIIQQLEHENIFIANPEPINNTRVRISYMLNDFSDIFFKDYLQRQEKTRDKWQEVANIYDVLVHSGGDLLRQYVLEPSRESEIENILDELFKYGNTIFQSMRKRYVSVLPRNIYV